MARKNQFERKLVRRPCIAHLREQLGYNQLKRYPFLYWTCPPDHGRVQPHVANAMKLDGYEKGVYDLTIGVANPIESKLFLIEFKYQKNDLTTEQKLVWNKAAGLFHIYPIIIKSLDEFKEFCKIELK